MCVVSQVLGLCVLLTREPFQPPFPPSSAERRRPGAIPGSDGGIPGIAPGTPGGAPCAGSSDLRAWAVRLSSYDSKERLI